MSDAERAVIAGVFVVGLFGIRYLFGIWRLGEPWRKHLGTMLFSIGFATVVGGALLLGPPAVGLFGLPALLVVLGVLYLRQSPQDKRPLAWLTIAVGAGGILLNLLRIALFGTQ